MLSSDGHKASQLPKNKIDFATMKSAQLQYNGITKYCQSKLADAVYAAPIAKRHPQFTTVAINPGEVSTGLFNKGTDGGGWVVWLLAKVVAPLLTKPVEEGCKNSLWSATSKDAKNGKYYDPVGKPGQESQVVKDGKLGEELWEWTQRELNDYTL
jgi:retinol dehydrogenase 12